MSGEINAAMKEIIQERHPKGFSSGGWVSPRPIWLQWWSTPIWVLPLMLAFYIAGPASIISIFGVTINMLCFTAAFGGFCWLFSMWERSYWLEISSHGYITLSESSWGGVSKETGFLEDFIAKGHSAKWIFALYHNSVRKLRWKHSLHEWKLHRNLRAAEKIQKKYLTEIRRSKGPSPTRGALSVAGSTERT